MTLWCGVAQLARANLKRIKAQNLLWIPRLTRLLQHPKIWNLQKKSTARTKEARVCAKSSIQTLGRKARLTRLLQHPKIWNLQKKSTARTKEARVCAKSSIQTLGRKALLKVQMVGLLWALKLKCCLLMEYGIKARLRDIIRDRVGTLLNFLMVTFRLRDCPTRM